MSTFTRITTPAFSANPLQTFITYKQARRAARAGGVVAIVYGALSAAGFFQVMIMTNLGMPQAIKQVSLGVIAVLTVLILVLGWRMWVKPGCWKALLLLMLALLNLIGAMVQFSILSLIIMGVTLNFCVVAFRGALAMKRLQAQAQMQADLDAF